MMLHKGLISGFGILLLAALVLVIGGCGDDDANIPIDPGDDIVVGDLDDPDFVLVQTQIASYLSESEEFLSVGLQNIYQFPTDTEEIRNQHNATGPVDTVAYDYKNGWHLVYISRYNLVFNDFVMDSIQFKSNDEAIQSPVDVDYLHFIRNWRITDNRLTQTRLDRSGYINFEFANLDSNICNVNGTNNAFYQWYYISGDTNINANFDMEVNVQDLNVGHSTNYGWNNGCPITGTLSMTLNEFYRETVNFQSDSWVANWAITIQFEDGTANVDVARGNVHWTYTCDLCTPPYIE